MERILAKTWEISVPRLVTIALIAEVIAHVPLLR
jgi:hypothetical protein